jgi:hypothetical protein
VQSGWAAIGLGLGGRDAVRRAGSLGRPGPSSAMRVTQTEYRVRAQRRRRWRGRTQARQRGRGCEARGRPWGGDQAAKGAASRDRCEDHGAAGLRDGAATGTGVSTEASLGR